MCLFSSNPSVHFLKHNTTSQSLDEQGSVQGKYTLGNVHLDLSRQRYCVNSENGAEREQNKNI